MWAVARGIWEQRQRLAPLILVAGACVVGLTLARSMPQETEVRIRVSPDPTLTEVRVTYTKYDEEHASARYAVEPNDDFRFRGTPHLAPGRYDVCFLLIHSTSQLEVPICRTLDVPVEGTVVFDLRREANP